MFRFSFRGFFLLFLMSAAFTCRAELRQDIEYSHPGRDSLLMDAYTPDGPGPFPAIILVHGGGWVRGNRRTDVAPLFKPLEKAGFAWFSISYRLAGEDKGIASLLFMKNAMSDVQQAVVYVKAHAGEFRIDPDRIALVGESAGAQLAAMAALKPGPAGPVRAVVAFYGPSDLVALAQDSNQIPDSLKEQIRTSGFADIMNAGLKQVSPLYYVQKDMPPFLLIHGTSDTLVPFQQSVRLCQKIEDAGASCELFPVRGAGHGMNWWESLHLTAYKQHMIDWLKRELTPLPSAARQYRSSDRG